MMVKNDLEQKSEEEILADIATLEQQVGMTRQEPSGPWTSEEDDGPTIDAEAA
jgi:hypothetical protein